MKHGHSLCSLPLFFIVPQGAGSLRLDAALGLAVPNSGLRARRRLWEYCHISVNGRRRGPGFTVSDGDSILVEDAAAHAPTPPDAARLFQAPEVALSGPDYLAFVKPCGLHSAHVAGSPEPSLEAVLPSELILLTRLDKATSGLVLAARSPSAACRFRELEAGGKVEKHYLAVLRGRLDRPITVAEHLCTANTTVTRVFADPDPDPARHSVVRPLKSPLTGEQAEGKELTLAEVVIQRGARHQIRTHLAHAGYPLLGEDLYAPAVPGLAPGCLFLHHARVSFPGFSAACPPPWPSCFLEEKPS